MTRFRLPAAVLLFFFISHSSALAVNPDEVLEDRALETRARRISSELRCLVCQNQSIDISDADLAKDLRVIVRERLTAGDTDRQVMDYVVARYGEFVLLKPSFSARNAVLWGAPLLVVLIGALVLFRQSKTPAQAAATSSLSPEEERRLGEIMTDRTKL
jgi:cytochrome c-type biogenesis protein CcmH